MGRKRKSGEGTVRLRKDGRWEGRVVVGYDDKGLPKTKNVLAKTKTECVAKLESLKESVAPATAVKTRADMPFGEWVEFWYKNYSKPMLRPSSQRSYEDFIRLYIRPKLGSVPLNKLTMNDLQRFFNWMRKDGRTLHRETRGGGLSDNMVRNCHSLCRRALEKAVAERLIVKNPIEECKAPPIRRKEMHLLPSDWRSLAFLNWILYDQSLCHSFFQRPAAETVTVAHHIVRETTASGFSMQRTSILSHPVEEPLEVIHR